MRRLINQSGELLLNHIDSGLDPHNTYKLLDFSKFRDKITRALLMAMREPWVLISALERQPKSFIEGGPPSHLLRWFKLVS